MENYKNIDKKIKIGLLVSLLLIVCGIVATSISLFNHIANISTSFTPAMNDLINIVIYLCVLYYALVGYKKPHGNLLKTMYLIFGVGLVGQAIVQASNSNNSLIASFCNAIAAVIISYTAGRLNRIEKNKKLQILAGLLMLIGCCMAFVDRGFDIRRILTYSGPIVINATLGFAYSARYEEHKAAGLEEK